MYGGCLLCPVYPLLIETVSCLLLLRVASGKRLKNLKKSGQLLHVFLLLLLLLLLLLSLLDILMILNAKWIIHFLTRTFISKAFVSILQRS